MAARKAAGGQESQGVEVALAPEELELDPMAMTQKYEEHVREQQAQVEKEDFSDMVAEHAAKQKVRRAPFILRRFSFRFGDFLNNDDLLPHSKRRGRLSRRTHGAAPRNTKSSSSRAQTAARVRPGTDGEELHGDF